jgi:hypothetical protein
MTGHLGRVQGTVTATAIRRRWADGKDGGAYMTATLPQEAPQAFTDAVVEVDGF